MFGFVFCSFVYICGRIIFDLSYILKMEMNHFKYYINIIFIEIHAIG